MMREVCVSIPLEREDWPNLEREIRSQFGPEGDTGCGLGYSDTNFPVASRKDGKTLKRRIWGFLSEKGIPVGDTWQSANDNKTVIVTF